MSLDLDLSVLPPAARKVLGGGAPAPLRMMAAKGVIPGAKPEHIVTVLAALSTEDDKELSSTASASLKKLPAPVISGALSAELQEPIVTVLCRLYVADHDVIVSLLRMAAIGQEALELLASAANERIGELLATNEQRMLEFPTVIEKLYLNKNVRMSTADRLLELAVRHGLELNIPAFKEAAAAIQNELIPEASEEPSFDDQLFAETRELSENLEKGLEDGDTHEVNDEGQEEVKKDVRPLFVQISEMSVSAKIRKAMLGNTTARMLLIRDKNKLVASAAAQSPKMGESEAVTISASRAVTEDVLRHIARNREFTRSYQVKLNLVSNPRCPFTYAAAFVPHLRDNDLRMLTRSKNVPGQISRAARQQLSRKKKQG